MAQAQKSTVLDVRRANRSAVLRRIYQAKSISRQELSHYSGLSPATVTNVVVELLQEGIVLESGIEASQGGRPRSILTMNPQYGFFIGVEAGDTFIRVELFDLPLRSLSSVVYALSADENQPEQVVQYIQQGVHAVLEEKDIAQENVIGIGISVGGLVEKGSAFLPGWGWRNVPLVTLLEEDLYIPISLENAAKAMTQAESLFGAGQGYDDIAGLLIGTGIGAGIIVNGSLYRGVNQSAGEWGHTTIVLDGRPCRCGSYGCLEAYAGAPGIIERLREIAPESALLQSNDQESTISALVMAARDKDPIATQVLKDTAHYLGVGIANLINIFNPQLIIIGGWVGLAIGEYILPELHQFIARYALKLPFSTTKIKLSPLGQNATAMGAAAVVLEHFLLTAGKPNSYPLR